MPQERKPDLLPFSDRARFERSDEWQAIMRAVSVMCDDLIAKCCDHELDLKQIRYAQGGVDICRWLYELPSVIFEEE